MKEDCATDMSASQGCIEDKAVIEKFKDALKERIGADRFRLWFHHGVSILVEGDTVEGDTVEASVGGEPANPFDTPSGRIVILVSGQFALDRMRQNFMQPIRAAAAQVYGSTHRVALELERKDAVQPNLPLGDDSIDRVDAIDSDESIVADKATLTSRKVRPGKPAANRSRQSAKSLSSLLSAGAGTTRKPKSRRSVSLVDQPRLPNFETANTDTEATSGQASSNPLSPAAAARAMMTLRTFVSGSCNQLAHTAVMMACQNPSAATPLFLYGPSGIGKTHLANAIADQFRRVHRMRRVMQISGEKFTNDFCKSVGSSGLPAFRKRYRDVDALIIDDVQFLSSKSATLREMLYTVEALIETGRPIIFTANQAPSEIDGLSRELIGRMASGLVCPMHALDTATRLSVLRGLIEQRCDAEWPESTINQINAQLAGDGRLLSGVVNLVATLQKMLERMPTMEEIRQFGGDLLRTAQPTVSLASIERVVCEAFQLPVEDLRGSSQARAVCEPRMLAMYLSRQLTSSAYAQIAGHFGGRSHSTAIAAERNVKKWLDNGKSIGRGNNAVSAREAIDRIETLLRTG
ncbi:Chromosomal replication initiator protein DnaA [Novipirellula aureliae]|uniref:Chromosomal replication initiator protein DnaA n=1 Tax=Novipirellula aureliae TaxID=2527966 RepID=A0A5C6E0V8_9BACT|nr:DnaA/Hda family protein [Novipirellula aureliae]TWU41587.1 Chromosomal replication initiator protein DnaA [Novipirellula aureliae]